MEAIEHWYPEYSLHQERRLHRILEMVKNTTAIDVYEIPLTCKSYIILTIRHIELQLAMTHFIMNMQGQKVPSLLCQPMRFSTYLPVNHLEQIQMKSYNL